MDFSGYICNYDCNNTASACYSSVFGGGGSSSGHNVAGDFGQNVTSAFNNTMHIEWLFMQNTPLAGTAPLGTVSCVVWGPGGQAYRSGIL